MSIQRIVFFDQKYTYLCSQIFCLWEKETKNQKEVKSISAVMEKPDQERKTKHQILPKNKQNTNNIGS